MKAYLVSYESGSYDSYYKRYLFITMDEEKAIAYVNKFNRILAALKEHIKRYETEGGVYVEDGVEYIDDPELKEEYIHLAYKYWEIQDANKAFYEDIEVR